MSSDVKLMLHLMVKLQVRESDPEDIFGNKVVQLLDDFRISGVNGNRK